VTTAIAPAALLEEMHRRMCADGFDRDHVRYVSYQQEIGRAIQQNHDCVLERLGKYLARATNLQGGFNCLVELEPFTGKDEDEVSRQLFEETGVAILTESCFRVSPRHRPNFWVRMSLAAPPDRFATAVDRLAGFLAGI
jgi:aspartate/methionine/tyrosine aminotransferase